MREFTNPYSYIPIYIAIHIFPVEVVSAYVNKKQNESNRKFKSYVPTSKNNCYIYQLYEQTTNYQYIKHG